MKFGAHCVLYGEEIGTDTDKVIGRLAAVGAEGCELGERFFGVDEREKLTNVLENFQIDLAGMHCNHLNLSDLLYEPEKSRKALEKVAQFVAPFPNKNVIATGNCGNMEELRERQLKDGSPLPELHDPEKVKLIAARLDQIVADIREKYGVQVHYHNHSWEFCDEGLIWFSLAEYAPNLMFAMDTGWVAGSGFDPVKLIERYPNRFHYVHLRDYKKVENPNELTFHQVHTGFKALGTGDMNYPRLMETLDKILAPNDWAIVEYEIGNFDQNSYLSALSYLQGIRDSLSYKK